MYFYMPTRLFTGENCLFQNSGMFASYGSRCLIVTGKHAAKQSGALDDVMKVLEENSISASVYDGVTQNPPLAACMEAGSMAHETGADFLIGIGGGSSLDAAKAASVFAANEGLDEAGFYSSVWPNSPLPVILVGTTSGTGSEMTRVAVLTDSRGRKHSIKHDLLSPALSFGDSRYTENNSLPLTLTTGVDALAHCLESYFSFKGDEISRSFAVRGVRLLFHPLSAAADGAALTKDERRQLYEASILGGLAINTSGTGFPHNMGYFLTERYHVPHGFACAEYLPELLTLAGEYDPAYAACFYAEAGVTEMDLTELIRRSVPDPKVVLSKSELEELLPRWENNGSVKNSRCSIDLPIVRSILEKKFSGK